MLATAPVVAHHAFAAEFDVNRPVKITGTLTKMEWINPHAWIHIEEKAANGETNVWEFEAGAPNALLRRGWNKNSLRPGTQVTITGYQALDGTFKANARDITLPDGRRLFSGSAEEAYSEKK